MPLSMFQSVQVKISVSDLAVKRHLIIDEALRVPIAKHRVLYCTNSQAIFQLCWRAKSSWSMQPDRQGLCPSEYFSQKARNCVRRAGEHFDCRL